MIEDDEYDSWLKEEEEMKAAEEAEYKRREELSVEWKKKWPNHCTACGGWGGGKYFQSHPYGMGSAYEEMFEPCESVDITVCHRCGEHGLNEDGEGPCTHCGWDYNDGDPLFT